MCACGVLGLIPVLAAVGRFPLPGRSLNACVLVIGWMALITLEMLVAGAVGWLRPWPLAGMSVLVAVPAVVWGRAWLQTGIDGSRRAGQALCQSVTQAPIVAGLLGAASLVLLARQLFHVWFLPPYVYDVLVYHLPRVADWVREGRLVMVGTPVLRTWWPANFELLQTWVAVFFHHDAVIELPGLVAYAALAAGVFALLRAALLSRRWAAWLTLACAMTPAIAMQAVSCKNDLAVAAVYIALVAVWMDADREVESDPARWFWSMIAFAWGMGVKPYLAVISVGLLPWLVWLAWKRHRAGLPVARFSGARSDRRWLWIAGVAAAPLALFWYVRNIAYFGNPLYPAMALRIGSWEMPGTEGLYKQGSFSLSALATTVRDLVARKLWDEGQPFNPELGNMAGWGWFVLGCAVPLSVLALREAWFRRLALMFGLSFLLLFSWVNADPWNMRFAIWVPVLFVVGYGVGLRQLSNGDIRRAFVWLAPGLCLLNMIGTLNNGYYRSDEWRGQLDRRLAEREAFSKWGREMARLPVDAVVAYRMGDNDPLYLLHGAAMSRRPVYLSRIHDAADLQRQMSAAKAEWLFLPSPAAREENAVEDLMQRGVLRKMGNGLYELTEYPAHRPTDRI